MWTRRWNMSIISRFYWLWSACLLVVIGLNKTSKESRPRLLCKSTKRQLSVPPLRGRLLTIPLNAGGKRAYHAMQYSPVSVVLRLRLVSIVRAEGNGNQRRPMGPWGSGKDFTLRFTFYMHLAFDLSVLLIDLIWFDLIEAATESELPGSEAPADWILRSTQDSSLSPGRGVATAGCQRQEERVWRVEGG